MGAVFDEDRADGRPNEVPWVSKRPADGVFLFVAVARGAMQPSEVPSSPRFVKRMP